MDETNGPVDLWVEGNYGKAAASKLQKDAPKNPVVANMNRQDDKEKRWQQWSVVDELVSAARDLYCNKNQDFNSVTNDLSEALEALTGEEKEEQKDGGDKDEAKEDSESTS